MGATVDCEAIRDGLLGQPANAVSSLALVVAGAWLLRRADSRWVASGLVATGIGSFLFHGPLAPGGEWIHDVTLAWLLAVVLSEIRGWPARVHLIAGLAMAGAFWLFPASADGTAAAIAVAIGVTLLRSRPTPTTLAQLATLASLATIGRLGATGGPLCHEHSLIQPHAVWHVGAACVVTWWSIGHQRARVPVE